MSDLIFRKAKAEDTPRILALYRSLIGAPGCTWAVQYPAPENVAEDIALHSLFLLEEEGEIVAVASAGAFHELEDLPRDPEIQHPCELARVGVSREQLHRGLASRLLERILADLPARGFDGMLLLASVTNPPALGLYEKYRFRRTGDTVAMYGHTFYFYQLRV